VHWLGRVLYSLLYTCVPQVFDGVRFDGEFSDGEFFRSFMACLMVYVFSDYSGMYSKV
jgi:hypothetical protein